MYIITCEQKGASCKSSKPKVSSVTQGNPLVVTQLKSKENCIVTTYSATEYTLQFQKLVQEHIEEILKQRQTATQRSRLHILYLHVLCQRAQVLPFPAMLPKTFFFLSLVPFPVGSSSWQIFQDSGISNIWAFTTESRPHFDCFPY